MAVLKKYSIARDVSLGDVNLATLTEEIQSRGLVDNFDGINRHGDVLEILGDSCSDIEGLDSIVSAHDPQVKIPESVENWKLRVALNSFGVSDAQVQTFIDTFQGNQKVFANAAWHHAPTVSRKHPLVSALGHALGLDENSLDNLFIEASKI